MRSFESQLTIFSVFLVCLQVPSIFVFVFKYTSISRITFAVLRKPCQGNSGKFQRSGESRFGSSEKDRKFLKILKWRQELARFYKWGKLVSYFLNNAANTCLYNDWKFQRTLTWDISFSLEQFFISVAILTQVASVSLIYSGNVSHMFVPKDLQTLLYFEHGCTDYAFYE